METMNIFSLARGAESSDVRLGPGAVLVFSRKSRNVRVMRASRTSRGRRERFRERRRKSIVLLEDARPCQGGQGALIMTRDDIARMSVATVQGRVR